MRGRAARVGARRAGGPAPPRASARPPTRPPRAPQILSELQPDNFAYAPNYTTVWTVLNLGGLPDHTGKVAAASLPAPPDLPPLKIVLPPESDQPFGGAEPPPSTLDKSFWFESFDNAQNVSFFYVNGTSFQPPTSPGDPSLLERIYGNPSGATYTNAGTTPPPGGVGWNVVDLPLGSVLDITIRNYDNGQARTRGGSWGRLGGGLGRMGRVWAAGRGGARACGRWRQGPAHTGHPRAYHPRAAPHPHTRAVGVHHEPWR